MNFFSFAQKKTAVQRLFLLVGFSLTTVIGGFGHTEKADLVGAVAWKHCQLPGVLVEHVVIQNLSPEIWKKMAGSCVLLTQYHIALYSGASPGR